MRLRICRTSATLRITGSFFSGAGRTIPKMAQSTIERVLVEEADPTDGDRHRVAGVMFDILDKEKVLAQFFLRDQVWRLVIMFGQLPHGPHVTLLSALGQTAQLQTLDHSLSQFSHGYTSGLKS
jgi:hypothetical protein